MSERRTYKSRKKKKKSKISKMPEKGQKELPYFPDKLVFFSNESNTRYLNRRNFYFSD